MDRTNLIPGRAACSRISGKAVPQISAVEFVSGFVKTADISGTNTTERSENGGKFLEGRVRGQSISGALLLKHSQIIKAFQRLRLGNPKVDEAGNFIHSDTFQLVDE